MGRTKRKRRRLKFNECATTGSNLDHEIATINLRKWLTKNSWTDCAKLQLRNFPETGRGVCSLQDIHANEILIQMPLYLMITYQTLYACKIVKEIIQIKHAKFKIHELLALFLAIEKHKAGSSFWKDYINTLPWPPPTLPCFAPTPELNLYPTDLQVIARKTLTSFNESFVKVTKSINATFLICDCCKKALRCVISYDLFKWAYVVVNTRAVYVDPQVCGMNNYSEYLSDDPSMALCPFLDMFNHHNRAKTDVRLVAKGEQTYFQLSCLTSYIKYDQIFIVYGAHDNYKLLTEYGFYIPENEFDTVNFDYGDLLRILDLSLDDRQFRFVRDHNLVKHGGLFINSNGASFNLKAFLYVGYNSTVRNFSTVIFSDLYNVNFEKRVIECLAVLLRYKLKDTVNEVNRFKVVAKSESSLLVLSFLSYRISFLQSLIDKITNSE